ncbi:probable disease resistance protein At4g33300 [Quercus suber]|uniref:probable disease resistance protein At4g33300 n=1 Tax=Quercus suber TaxID=58331 RepID=UPI0032DFEB6A
MDLASFPEGQRVTVPSLIDMWAELDELDEHGNDAIDNLHELTTRNLATLMRTRKESKDASESNNYYTCYNEDFVTQHDPLRELAIYESSWGPIRQRKRLIMDINKNTLPKWCTKQDQHLMNGCLLSISTVAPSPLL